VSRPSILLGFTGLRIDGGIASVSRCMARALDECVREGRVSRTDRVLLLEPPEQPAALPSVGTQLLSRGSQARFVWQLWRSFLRHRHDLVLFDLVGLARSVMLPLPGLAPRRFAIFVHGIELEAAREGSRGRALRSATRILANSEFTAETVRSAFPEVAERVRVVPLCIDPERTAAWERAGGSASAREPVALIVGRMWSDERGKGHDELIEAWPAVARSIPGAQLWVAGAGDDASRLAEKAAGLGVGESVRFLGRVSDAELADLYGRAAVYAMPSRQEGFGLAYAEAMWFGLPCIGSTADAASHVIRNGETGLLVPYGDVAALEGALVGLLGDPEKARRLGEGARRLAVEHFTYPRFRERLLAALDLS
jgi:phosphatidylinositol alpha-1,6-mannosyltransferase